MVLRGSVSVVVVAVTVAVVVVRGRVSVVVVSGTVRVVVVRGRVSVVVVSGTVTVVVVRGRVSVVVVVVAETRGQMLSITLPMPFSDATLSTQSLWTSFSIVVAFPVQPVVWLKRGANL